MKADWDVIIIGGGTAGLFAGIASARLGAQTLLIERSGFLGGNMATGMNVAGFFDGADRQVVRGIPKELGQRVVKAGGGRGHIFVHDRDRWISSAASLDPEVFKHVAFEMVAEFGCKLWLYTGFIDAAATNREVTSVEVTTKVGVVKLTARVFIDASGDADVAASVGAPFERGGGSRQQAVTCIFRVGNVDLTAVERYMEERVNTEHKTRWNFAEGPMRLRTEGLDPLENVSGAAEAFSWTVQYIPAWHSRGRVHQLHAYSSQFSSPMTSRRQQWNCAVR